MDSSVVLLPCAAQPRLCLMPGREAAAGTGIEQELIAVSRARGEIAAVKLARAVAIHRHTTDGGVSWPSLPVTSCYAAM